MNTLDLDSLNQASCSRLQAGAQKYRIIMDLYWKVSVEEDREFQRQFNGFYRVRQRSSAWYAEFFALLEQLKTRNRSFGEILREMYDRTGRLEASFASKMLATRHPEFPVIDRWVLDNLGLRLPRYGEKDKLEKVVGVYESIVTWYHEFLITPAARQAMNRFDQLCPNCAVTPLKKVDFILWQTRSAPDKLKRPLGDY